MTKSEGRILALTGSGKSQVAKPQTEYARDAFVGTAVDSVEQLGASSVVVVAGWAAACLLWRSSRRGLQLRRMPEGRDWANIPRYGGVRSELTSGTTDENVIIAISLIAT